MEDLSCQDGILKIGRQNLRPSVFLFGSMIERGKRIPSEDVWRLFANVFKKKCRVVFGMNIFPKKTPLRHAKRFLVVDISGMALRTKFFISPKENTADFRHFQKCFLKRAPGGRQFATLLHPRPQEHKPKNHFPI